MKYTNFEIKKFFLNSKKKYLLITINNGVSIISYLSFGEFIKYIIELYSYTEIDNFNSTKKFNLDDFINTTYSDSGFVENIISATEYRMYWYYALVDGIDYDYSLNTLNKLDWLDIEIQKQLKKAYTIALRKNKIESLYV